MLVFFKIDLRSSYHQLNIRLEDVPYAAFRTRYGYNKFLVMPLVWTNVSTTFMILMNGMVKPLLDSFLIVFIDEILIYSKSKEEHVDNLCIILGV